jgi:hypothetical protein
LPEITGEYTLVIAPDIRRPSVPADQPLTLLKALIDEGVTPTTLAKALRQSGMGRTEAFELAQKLKHGDTKI